MAGLLASATAQASPIDFTDNGATTTRASQGLEWHDVTATVTHSYVSITAELASGRVPELRAGITRRRPVMRMVLFCRTPAQGMMPRRGSCLITR